MDAIEVWKPVVGFEGTYEVSVQLGIRRIATGRILKQSFDTHGRPRVCLCLHGKQTTHRVAHLVADAFLPPKGPTDQVLRHLNDIKTDNRIENLAWGTYSDNTADSIRNGGWKPPPMHLGEKQHFAKLTEDTVREIRRLYATGKFTQQELALQFGVVRSVISDIVKRKAWRHAV